MKNLELAFVFLILAVVIGILSVIVSVGVTTGAL